MQITNALISISIFLLGASAQYSGPNGKRYCVGGAISCEYQKGRCANVCNDTANSGSGTVSPVLDTVCSCPAGQADNLYTGAACIDVIRALGRQGC